MSDYEYRVGQGIDVHQLARHEAFVQSADRYITLCGWDIPSAYYLVGHSDADAGLHALTDALLGAIGKGDIGTYFPNTDPQWEDADSRVFLYTAKGEVDEMGGRIVNVDITLVCEKPKIQKYRAPMIEQVAEILEINPGRVGVKATTSEKLGFTGREEGLLAMAVVSIELPRSAY